ncbi:hypothetical protein JHK85_012597 [Glycine max]|nr:hypothetical protein JHK85_012597 [Glycine max]
MVQCLNVSLLSKESKDRAHTIGYARCFTLKQRLFNCKGTGKPDPSLDASLLQHLQKLCPDNNSSNPNLAPLDPVTTYTFDSMYYKNLVKNLGLLPTDKALVSDGTTASLVYKYSQCSWSGGLLFGMHTHMEARLNTIQRASEVWWKEYKEEWRIEVKRNSKNHIANYKKPK